MNTKGTLPRDVDLAGAGKALKRAAKNARELSRKTQTPFYVFEDGKIIDVLKRTKKQFNP
jgi:diaminopimelate decarboxylase